MIQGGLKDISTLHSEISQTPAKRHSSEKDSMTIFLPLISISLLIICSSCTDLKKFEDGKNGELTTNEVYKKYPDLRPLWEKNSSEGIFWSQHLLLELEKIPENFLSTIPTDSNIFCPNYASINQDQRKYFWAFLMSLMVMFESGFDPEAQYEEGFEDSTGNPVISRGLLQISFESSQSYNCGFKVPADLHDPYQNLTCGLKILSKWVPSDKSIAGHIHNHWRGGARYWSVLRAGDKESYKTIVDRTSQLTICTKKVSN